MIKKSSRGKSAKKNITVKTNATQSKKPQAKTSKLKAKSSTTTTEIIIGGGKAKLIKKGNVSVLKMERPKLSKTREHRIMMEYIVDCYDEEERAMGWYYSLESKLTLPFMARCIREREVSPLQLGDEVEVIDMASEDECQNEIFVKINWGKRGLAVPLYQLQGLKVDKETKEAIADWHYWVDMGYEY